MQCCAERWLYAGRVKTLHPGVHGGILARRDLQEHLDAMKQQSISLIDVVSSYTPDGHQCRVLQSGLGVQSRL